MVVSGNSNNDSNRIRIENDDNNTNDSIYNQNNSGKW